MALSLLLGPANAGKVERLLAEYLAQLERDPVLVVPTLADVERAEHELLALRPALIGGTIGRFDSLFSEVMRGLPTNRKIVSRTQRRLLLRRAVEGVRMNGYSRSARFAGFGESLLTVIEELEAALVQADSIDGHLGELYAAYRAELDRLGRWDEDLFRAEACDRLTRDFDAWDGRPVFAYGFEDLTGAQWRLLEALAARTDVLVSLPYEAGRPAFAALERTANDLGALAHERIEQLPPREVAEPALAHLERTLFSQRPVSPSDAPAIDGAIRFFEAAGTRPALELVADEILTLLRSGIAPERIGVICPRPERARAALETAFTGLGVPYAIDGKVRLTGTAFGQALVGILTFAWRDDATRHDLFRFLRSRYSSLGRAHVDYVEGRLRGRAISSKERVERETFELRGQPIPWLAELRASDDPLAALRELAAGMLRSAYGLERPPVGHDSRADLRAFEAVIDLVGELEEWRAASEEPLAREAVLGLLEGVMVRGGSPPEPGRVGVYDLKRARTRRLEVVFVLGLEEGTLPQRSERSPFLDEQARRELEDRARGARLLRPDAVGRDRHLFYTACTRPLRRLYLVREAANDEGSPRQPSPFWDAVRELFPAEDVARWTRRRSLSQAVWPLEQAPSERERLRALAALAAHDTPSARGIARANGWERRLERALEAFNRETRLTSPALLEQLRAKRVFGVTELETFADCSSMWLVDRLIDPRPIDAEIDPMLRGTIAHQALYKFFSGLPKQLGADRVDQRNLEPAIGFLRTCLDDAVRSHLRLEATELERNELVHGLWRDLEAFIRSEAESELGLVPRQFEVSFGSERSAPQLQRGLELGDFALSGKIDRIDVDPHSARGIVQDYKSGKNVHSAAKIDSERRLQLPLYMLVLRDLVGIEPLGGLYRALAGERKARGLLRAEASEDLPNLAKNDFLEEEQFWQYVDNAVALAKEEVGRMRAGDVRHDPLVNGCPTWCDRWSICRVRRA